MWKNLDFNELFKSFLAMTIIYACIFYFFAITLKLFPDIDVDGVRQVLPIFNSTFSMMVGYYFGSSASNKNKDAIINALTNAVPPPNSNTSREETKVVKTVQNTETTPKKDGE